MPLHLVRSSSTDALWSSFASGFLDELEGRTGPRGLPSHAWFAHRNHRDLLLEAAERRGVRGWLGRPFSFLSDLTERLGVEGRPAGLLTRRRLLARVAAEEGRRHQIHGGSGGIVRGHLLDGLFGELLPEGVDPEALAEALTAVADDAFANRRNAWVTATYRAYAAALRARGLFDPRSVPALLAEAVEEGRLPGAVGGATRLHVYGVHSLRTRHALIRALARQQDVQVRFYLPAVDGAEASDEWHDLPATFETLPAPGSEPPRVQPAPDARRELRWVAGEVKRILLAGAAEPHEIAVIARSGIEDTQRAHAALASVGVPATARIRTPLSVVPALRFLLEVLRGAASGWSYRRLRSVLAGPYLASRVELRFLDEVADERRVEGLLAWDDALSAALLRLSEGEPSEARSALVERLTASLAAFREFRTAVEPLSSARSEAEWIRTTQELMDPGLLGFRYRLCREVEDRWDVVRLDQRGVIQLEALLREWAALDLETDPLQPPEWHALLARLMEGHDLALTTPLHRGVQVLDAEGAALTPFRHVFVVHANDGVFPRLPSAGDVFTDGERAWLAPRLPLADRELTLARERALWRAVTGARAVSITYRTTDPSGTPLLPSLLVPEHDPATELPRTRILPEEPMSPSELALVRASELAARAPAGGAGAPVTLPEPTPLRHAVLVAHAERARLEQADGAASGRLIRSPWAGTLRDPVVLAHLERLFGAEHLWSAGQLEEYARCPFLFFVSRVLRLAEVAEADEETSALTFGGIAHDLLQRFYERVRGNVPAAFDARAEGVLQQEASELRREREGRGEWMGLPVLARQTWVQVVERIGEYLTWELPLMQSSRPLWMEYSFGFEGPPVELRGRTLDGRPSLLHLRGRVDRIDRIGEGPGALHHVLDYKTSTVPKTKGYLDGGALQPALYMSVVAQREGLSMKDAGYRKIRNPSGKKSSILVKWDSEAHRAALAVAFSIPARIRAGDFEPVQASSCAWAGWHPGIDVVRGRAVLSEGTRFHLPAGPASPEASGA